MFSKTFRGGVHPPGFKIKTSGAPIRKAHIPKRVVIPLSQHTGAPCEPVVTVGDAVKTGALIGKAAAFISSPVHSSISGKVTKISPMPHPVIGSVIAVIIENDGSIKEETAYSARDGSEIQKLSKEKLAEIVRDAGIVGLGGAAFPTHVKLSPPKGKLIDSVILNGLECEPFLTCDEQLMMERPQEILRGLDIIVKILGAANSYIAIEDNKPSAIEAVRKSLPTTNDQRPTTKLIVLPTKYPQGAEKQLIKSVLDREVPAGGGLPMDVGCVVHNVGTALAVYEAVHLGKPLIERCITITGDCVKKPSNLLVRIGTLVSDLVDDCGSFSRQPRKVIFGGPMMGVAQYTMDVPVIKGTSGIIFLSKDEALGMEEDVCIRCSKCLEVCPALLAPTTLASLVKKARWAEAEGLGIKECMECGACAYDCPAKIPLVDYIKLGKAKLATKK